MISVKFCGRYLSYQKCHVTFKKVCRGVITNNVYLVLGVLEISINPARDYNFFLFFGVYFPKIYLVISKIFKICCVTVKNVKFPLKIPKTFTFWKFWYRIKTFARNFYGKQCCVGGLRCLQKDMFSVLFSYPTRQMNANKVNYLTYPMCKKQTIDA